MTTNRNMSWRSLFTIGLLVALSGVLGASVTEAAKPAKRERTAREFIELHWTSVGAGLYNQKADLENTHDQKTIVVTYSIPNERDPANPIVRQATIFPRTFETIGVFKFRQCSINNARFAD